MGHYYLKKKKEKKICLIIPGRKNLLESTAKHLLAAAFFALVSFLKLMIISNKYFSKTQGLQHIKTSERSLGHAVLERIKRLSIVPVVLVIKAMNLPIKWHKSTCFTSLITHFSKDSICVFCKWTYSSNSITLQFSLT